MLAPSYHKSTSSSILSLHIHGTSQLVPDVLLTDPVLRLHVVHAATGEYVRIMQQLDSAEAQQQQQQQVQQQQQQVQQQQQRVQQQQEQRQQQEQQQGPATGGSSPSRLMGGSSSLPRTRHPVSNDVQAEVCPSKLPSALL
jgi:TolA-binding protein